MTTTIAVIAPSSVPFVRGGAEKFWWGLHKALTEHADASVELIKLPCKELTFSEIIESYHSFSQLDLSHFDMVISSKYPAWMVCHPRHVLYMQHTLRGLYDTYHFTGLPTSLEKVPHQLSDVMDIVHKEHPDRTDLARVFEMLPRLLRYKSLPSSLFSFPGPLIRELVHFFDRIALDPAHITAYFTISDTVKHRTGYLPDNSKAQVLHHPSDLIDFVNRSGEYIFTASRLTNMKRLHLIVEAMRYVDVPIPLRIAGEGPELRRLQALAAGDERIEFLGYVPDAQLTEYYSRALFVPFVPYDEDYGLITIEAMRSGKPVVTVSDAGGVCEFVFDGKTGYCTDPTPKALGVAMQKLAAHPEHARELGQNAQELVSSITWKNTVTSLLDHTAKETFRRVSHDRQKILVVTTFPAAHPISGGQRRVHYLCQALAQRYFVELICIGYKDQDHIVVTEVSPYFYELRVPWSEEAIIEEQLLMTQTGMNTVGDIAYMDICKYDKRLIATLQEHGSDAAFVIASHPYLYPAIQQSLPDTEFCYDAHNVEIDMKESVLYGYQERDVIIERVKIVEEQCCLRAQMILACSREDKKRFMDVYNLQDEQIIVIPNGYNPAEVPYADISARRSIRNRLDYDDTYTAIFMGSLHRPNIEAVESIKKMATLLPEIRFLIMGSVCEHPDIQKDSPPNAYYVGVIPEKEKHILLCVANVALNPITTGSGSNLKLIEYIAAGLETLSTPFGLRGFNNDPQLLSGVRVCELDNFVDALREILVTPFSEEDTAKAAKRVSECFSWDALMRQLPETLAHISAAEVSLGDVCPPN